MIPEKTVAFAALVPSVVAASALLHRRWHRFTGAQRASIGILAIYIPFLLGVTMGNIPLQVVGDRIPNGISYVQPVPLATIGDLLDWIADDPRPAYLRELIGNFVLLAPLGFLLPSIEPRLRTFRRALVIGFAASLAIETVQLLVSLNIEFPYRVFDVDDLLLNTAGAACGWLLWSATLGSASGQEPETDT